MSTVPEVQDWTRVVQLYAWDGTQLRPVKVDASGQLYVLMVGYDGTTWVPIKVDSEGNIISIMYGTYVGVLKPCAVDSEGRLIMIPTDPADVWGNAISMGNAELAAALGFAHRYDHRGNIFFVESFENGVSRFDLSGDGILNAQELSSTFAVHGGQSLKLTGGSDGLMVATAIFSLPYPILGKIGIELAFTFQTIMDNFEVRFYLYDGAKTHQGGVRYVPASNKIQYYSSAPVWADLITSLKLKAGPPTWHQLKLVLDFSADKYTRCLIDNKEQAMSTLAIYTHDDNSDPQLFIEIVDYSTSGNNAICYVDGIIITQNEPA